MLEIRFDLTGQRYVEFSKNRRGGSGTGKRLYYRLNEEGKVVYDERRWNETEEMRDFENKETIRQHDLTSEFEKIFLSDRTVITEEEHTYSVVSSEFS
jgi:DNA-binding PadR family transcriptional regulator